MKIIAISAKARCGKDTAAAFMTNFKHLNAITYALASPFKDAIANRFSDIMTHADVYGSGVDRNNEIFYISPSDFITRAKLIFLDFGYNLDSLKINLEPVIGQDISWTIRRIMQVIGSDIGCDLVDKMIWMKLMDEEISKLQGDYDTIIITDCRQAHELAYIRSLGSEILNIIRDTGLEDSHVTEKGLPSSPEDYVIHNNGTLEEFLTKVQDYVSQLK